MKEVELEALDQYWDALVRGEPAPNGLVDPASLSAIRQLQTAVDGPGPSEAFVTRLQSDLLDRPGPRMPEPTATAPIPAQSGHLRLARFTKSPRFWPAKWPLSPIPALVATTVLFLIVASSFALISGRSRLGIRDNGQPNVVSAPSSVDRSDDLVWSLTLPRGTLPDGRFYRFEIWNMRLQPDASGAYPATPADCCQGLLVDVVVNGSATYLSEEKMQVTRAGAPGIWEETLPGVEVVLFPGDSVARPANVLCQITNAGDVQLDILDFTFTMSNIPVSDTILNLHERGFARPDQELPLGDLKVVVRKQLLEPGEEIPRAARTSQTATDTGFISYIKTERDGTIRNTGPESLEAFVMTIEHVDGLLSMSS